MEQGFSEGSLVKISLTNFMTFSEVTFVPGPKLNLVIGPNGSGKSSLSCAMVLGLAGKTKILGRAPEVGQYVKRGTRTAIIEIELYRRNNNNVVIKRTMTLDNKTTWHINEKPSNIKEIEALMKSLQIQVDNLCQFLPQDRVHDFAKMNKQELLENTQKSVGSPQLFQTFLELKSNKTDDTAYHKNIKDLHQRLDVSKEKYTRMESEIQRVRKKQKMLKDVEDMNGKKGWMNYDAANERLSHRTVKMKAKQNELAKCEKEVEPFKKDLTECEKCFKVYDNSLSRQSIAARQCYGEAKDILNQVHHQHDKVEMVKAALRKTLEADARRAGDIKTKQDELDRILNSINSIDENELNAGLKKFEEEMDSLRNELQRLTNEEYEARFVVDGIKNELRVVNNKIEKENNVLNVKTQFLRTKDQSAYKLRNFVLENKHLFLGEIYGPLFLELNVTGQQHAKYVEACIPYRDKIAFVCENAKDVRKLLDICQHQLGGAKCNVLVAPPNKGLVRDVYKPRAPLNVYRDYGVQYFVLDVVKGPEPVLRYLCHMHRLHNIPVGNASAGEHLMNLFNLGCSRIFSEDFDMITKRSSYSNELSTRSTVTGLPYLFVHYATADPTLQKKAQELGRSLLEKNTELEAVVQRNQEHEMIRNKLIDEKKGLMATTEQLKLKKIRKESLEKEYKTLLRTRINKEAEEAKAQRQIKGAIQTSVELLHKLVSKANENQNSVIQYSLFNLKSERIQSEIARKKEIYKEACKQVTEAREALAQCEKDCLILKRDADVAFKEARVLTQGLSPKDAGFERFLKRFKEFPDTLDGIEQHINDFQARAECMGTNEQAIVEYDMIKKQIDTLEKEIKQQNDNFQELKTRMDKLKSQWLPEITKLVNTINERFSAIFRRMGCNGEVTLSQGEDKNDFMLYGLKIRVQFRETDTLQELDIFRQSGGERAVTIATFMLSLQELTHVPFRCVDEINQGMDEPNERRVFDFLVETVKNSNVSQYFLLTPKLLSGLKYGKDVSVHVIFNGTGALMNREWLSVSQRLEMLNSQRSTSRSLKRRHESDTESE